MTRSRALPFLGVFALVVSTLALAAPAQSQAPKSGGTLNVMKFTFDMLREGPDAPAKLRINPRKDWYANVEAVEAPDPYTVAFRLKRPQPSLLSMLATGYTPIYAAHMR